MLNLRNRRDQFTCEKFVSDVIIFSEGKAPPSHVLYTPSMQVRSWKYKGLAQICVQHHLCKPELCGKSVLTQLYTIEQRVGGGIHSTVLCCINDMHAGMDWVLV